jgi:hypothetical protein
MKPETKAGRALLVALRQPYPIPPAKPEDIVAAIEREAVARFLDTAEPKVAEALHRGGEGDCLNWEPGYEPHEAEAEMAHHRRDAARLLAHLRATVEGT